MVIVVPRDLTGLISFGMNTPHCFCVLFSPKLRGFLYSVPFMFLSLRGLGCDRRIHTWPVISEKGSMGRGNEDGKSMGNR